jgi:hypothetical protein
MKPHCTSELPVASFVKLCYSQNNVIVDLFVVPYLYTKLVGSQSSPVTSLSPHPSRRPSLPALNPSSSKSSDVISSWVKTKALHPAYEFSKMAIRSAFEAAPDRGTHTNPF